MGHTFLIGSFLQGYTSVFKYHPPTVSAKAAFDGQRLSSRFSDRAVRFAQRQKAYRFGVLSGLLGALVVVVLVFRLPFSPESRVSFAPVEQEIVAMEEILQTRQVVTPPPPPRPMILAVVPNDEILDETDLNLDVSLDLDDALVDLAPPALPDAEPEEEEAEIFMVVEQMPTMIGGLASLLKEVHYPDIARKQSIEGNVVVQVTVDEEGRPSDPVILRSASPLLEEAAVAAVMLQRFEPGRQRGRPVKVAVAIPVKFRLTT